jgi:ATP adenylyltransferase
VDQLWAPWRIEYVRSTKQDGCLFCQKSRARDDRRNLVATRGELCFVLLNTFPYNNGHLMVAPYEHAGELEALSAEQCGELMLLVQRSIQALKLKFRPDGFNVGWNLGGVAGAGIADHLHIHIVPRWNGDTSFMPVLSDTTVVCQSLEAAYEELTEAFAEIASMQD